MFLQHLTNHSDGFVSSFAFKKKFNSVIEQKLSSNQTHEHETRSAHLSVNTQYMAQIYNKNPTIPAKLSSVGRRK
jgi:hypothetical protein